MSITITNSGTVVVINGSTYPFNTLEAFGSGLNASIRRINGSAPMFTAPLTDYTVNGAPVASVAALGAALGNVPSGGGGGNPTGGTLDQVSQSRAYVNDGVLWQPEPLIRDVTSDGVSVASQQTLSDLLNYMQIQLNIDTLTIWNTLLSIAASTLPLQTAEILTILKTLRGHLPVTARGGETVTLVNAGTPLASNTNYNLSTFDTNRTNQWIYNDANQTVFLKFGNPNGAYTSLPSTWIDQRMIQLAAGAIYEVPQAAATMGFSAYYTSAPNATSRLKAVTIV